ncbi:hypothetical protein [Streptomyces sp. 196(2019)]|uniref:hypothetical protein n=1 Tax=Streptomyces sp. 196(2019) TaxID=2683820 RepID=UPI0013EA24C3|nr:hypothetical protein [Streptomyces sp. 196(2019)]
MAVKKGLSPEAVGHLGIGVVVRLVAGVKKLQKVVHEEIFAHLQRCGGGFLCVSRPEREASAEEVRFGPAVTRVFEEFDPRSLTLDLTGAPDARYVGDNGVLVVEEAVGELLQGGQSVLPSLFDPFVEAFAAVVVHERPEGSDVASCGVEFGAGCPDLFRPTVSWGQKRSGRLIIPRRQIAVRRSRPGLTLRAWVMPALPRPSYLRSSRASYWGIPRRSVADRQLR